MLTFSPYFITQMTHWSFAKFLANLYCCSRCLFVLKKENSNVWHYLLHLDFHQYMCMCVGLKSLLTGICTMIKAKRHNVNTGFVKCHALLSLGFIKSFLVVQDTVISGPVQQLFFSVSSSSSFPIWKMSRVIHFLFWLKNGPKYLLFNIINDITEVKKVANLYI